MCLMSWINIMKSAKYRKIYKALKQLARNIQFINRHSNYEVIGLILKIK